MIDKKLCDKNLQIEVSCGNAGNSIDGQLMSSGPKASGHDTDSVASGPPDECKFRGVATCRLRIRRGKPGLREKASRFDAIKAAFPALNIVCDAPI